METPEIERQRAKEEELYNRMDAVLERWYLSAICKSAGFTEEQTRQVFSVWKEDGLDNAQKVAEGIANKVQP